MDFSIRSRSIIQFLDWNKWITTYRDSDSLQILCFYRKNRKINEPLVDWCFEWRKTHYYHDLFLVEEKNCGNLPQMMNIHRYPSIIIRVNKRRIAFLNKFDKEKLEFYIKKAMLM